LKKHRIERERERRRGGRRAIRKRNVTVLTHKKHPSESKMETKEGTLTTISKIHHHDEEEDKTNETEDNNESKTTAKETITTTTTTTAKESKCQVNTATQKYSNERILQRLGEIELSLIKACLDEQTTETELRTMSARILESVSMNTELREKNRKLEIHCDRLVNHLNREQNRARIEVEKKQLCHSENEKLRTEIETLRKLHEKCETDLRLEEKALKTATKELNKVKQCFEEERKISKNLRSAIVKSKEKDATIESLQKELAVSSRRVAEFDQMRRDYLYFRTRVRELEMEARERAIRRREKKRRL